VCGFVIVGNTNPIQWGQSNTRSAGCQVYIFLHFSSRGRRCGHCTTRYSSSFGRTSW